MRSRAYAPALAALALAGCGNWSNDDVAFVQALPRAEHVQAVLPAGSGSAICAAPGESEVWTSARTTGNAFNALVDFMITFVDTVRTIEPTHRSANARSWGPFDDQKHPGFEVLIEMSRSEEDGVTKYEYTFKAGRKGSDLTSVLHGEFVGLTARTGHGSFALHFAELRSLGIDDNPDSDPVGDLAVQYDRASDPRTVDLTLADPTPNLASFDYGYSGYADGEGSFSFVFTNAQSQEVRVAAAFDATGAGRARVTVVLGPNSQPSYAQCWDSAGCITHVDDTVSGFLPTGISKLCTGGVCPSGPCPPLAHSPLE
jgi:hypothetical protein